jgi:hypothetical protein
MRRHVRGLAILATLVLIPALVSSGQARQRTLTCVGLYSETGAGYVSYRSGGGTWIVVKVGDVIPGNAEIRINVDRDWIEVTATDDPNAVYEVTGSTSGEVLKTVADVLKGPARTVRFPKGTAARPDAAFKDKLAVTQYLGRQIYLTSTGERKDIKYGDVFDLTGRVRIIGINNTITLMNASGGVTTVIGPLNFDVEKVLTNQALYKYLNVPR